MKKSNKDILVELSSGPVQQYILENENQDIRELVLKNKALFSIPVSRLSEQIGSRRKAKEKLPHYYNTPGIIYPPSENLEQCSSQATAIYKSNVVADLLSPDRAVCADLTGGFGVDTYYLSKKMLRMHFVEPQIPLMEIAQHNHKLLGAENIVYHSTTAEDFLRSNELTFDLVYLDPSRRPAGKKISALADSHPDVLSIQREIFKNTSFLMIKTSPLIDLQAGTTQLPFVKKIFVVSVDNECKEVLFVCEKSFDGIPAIEAVNISENRVAQIFQFTFPEEREQNIPYGDPLNYLYEPNASILKAGAFKSIAARFGLTKIAPSTHLYTANELIDSFPGKKFVIEKLVKPDLSEIRSYFPNGKANVTTRNYPLTPEALKRKSGLKDGGEKFLIGFSGMQKKFVVVAKRL